MVSNGEEKFMGSLREEESMLSWDKYDALMLQEVTDHSRLVRVLCYLCSYDPGGHEISFSLPWLPISSQINECICLKAFQMT